MILKKELDRIRNNSQAISTFEAAIQVLEDHRIIYFLRAFGRPMRDSDSTHDFLASEGAYNAGWQDCLDAIVNFKEMFLAQVTPNNSPSANYGARRLMYERGDITKEEFENGYTNTSGLAQSATTKSKH